MTLQELIEREGLTADVERVDSNPNMPADRWSETARHFVVTISKGERSMSVPFSQRSGHTADPTLSDVLDCLASDGTTYENARSFDDWAEELGMFPIESAQSFRDAEQSYRIIGEQSAALRDLLGDANVYETLLWDTERI